MKTPVLLLAGLLGGLASAAPTVTVTSMTQDPVTRTITVEYSLSDGPAVVTADFMVVGETAARRPVKSLFGDVNRKVAKSSGSFEWHPDADWGDQANGAQLAVKLIAWPLNGLPDYMVIDLSLENVVRFYNSPDNFPWPGGVTNDVCKTDKLVLRKIPAAGVTWRMGAPSNEAGHFDDEAPHMVTLTNDYYIGVYPITQRQSFLAWGKNPSDYSAYHDASMCPVQCISYIDFRGAVADFPWPEQGHSVSNLSFMGKLRTRVSDYAIEFDLPTEAQWEYACRAGTGTAFNNGESALTVDMDEIAWWSYNSMNDTDGEKMPRPVGRKKPNHWGLYDMHGNIVEHCLDWYAPIPYDSLAADTVVTNPVGPASGDYVVVRGGCWYQSAVKDFRSACRHYNTVAPTRRSHLEGGRVACPAEIH